MNGKSDHSALAKANETNAISAKLRKRKLPQLNPRKIRTHTANRIKIEKMVRSRGFPSSNAWDCDTIPEPSHCEGSRDAAMNIQISGIHKAKDVSGSLAGSKRKSAKRRTSHTMRATVGGMGLVGERATTLVDCETGAR